MGKALAAGDSLTAGAWVGAAVSGSSVAATDEGTGSKVGAADATGLDDDVPVAAGAAVGLGENVPVTAGVPVESGKGVLLSDEFPGTVIPPGTVMVGAADGLPASPGFSDAIGCPVPPGCPDAAGCSTPPGCPDADGFSTPPGCPDADGFSSPPGCPDTDGFSSPPGCPDADGTEGCASPGAMEAPGLTEGWEEGLPTLPDASGEAVPSVTAGPDATSISFDSNFDAV